MGRHKKLQDKQLVHGALPEVRCIDDILGRKWFNYKESTDAEYRSNLEKMNFSDLQRHAIEVGNIIPNVDRREMLISKLVKIYLERKFKFVGVGGPQKVETAPEEVLDILRRGK